MSQEVLNNSDLFAPDLTKEAIKDLEAFESQLKTLEASIKGFGVEASNSFSKLNKNSSKDFEKRLKLYSEIDEKEKQLIQTQKEQAKISKESQKLKKQLISSTDEEIKGKIRLQRANKEQKKQLEAEIILQNKQVKSVNDLKDANKALRIVRDSLDLETQVDEIKRLNDQIDINSDLIEGNVDSISQQKIGIGRYTEGVNSAIEANSELFNSFGPLGDVLKTLSLQMVNLTKNQEENENQSKKNEEQTNKNEKSTSKFSKTLKGLGKAVLATGLGAIVVVFGELLNQFRQTQDGAILFQKTLQKSFNFIRVVGAFTVDVIVSKYNVFSSSIEKLSLKFERLTEVYNDWTGDDQAESRIEQIDRKIKSLNKTIETNQENLDSLTYDRLTSQIESTNTAVDKLIDSQFELDNIRAKASINIQKQANEEERLQAIFDDDTRGFPERNQAAKTLLNVLKSSNSANDQALKLSKEALDVSRQRALIDLRQKPGLISQSDLKNLENQGSLTKAILADQDLIGKINIDIFNELKDAELEYLTTTGEGTIKAIDIKNKARKLLFDEVEQEVDFLIDGNDQIKTSNEKLIQQESKNLDDRKKILIETEKLITDSNVKIRDEIAKTVNGVEGGDIEAAFKASQGNVSALNKNLKELGLAEIPINRLLEQFKELQAQERDFIELNKELLESAKELESLSSDIELQELILNSEGIENAESFNKKLDKLQKDRTDLQIQGLRDRLSQTKTITIDGEEQIIKLLEDGSIEQAEVQKELNDLLLQRKKDFYDQEAADKKEADDKALQVEEENAEKRKEILENALKVAEDINKRITDNQLSSIQDQIKDVSEAKSILEAETKNGNDQIKGSIIDLNKKEQELQAKEARAKEAAQRREIVLAGLKSFAANSENGDGNALGKTITDITTLISVLSGLSGFYKGTEHVGRALGRPHLPTSTDNYVIRVDGEERILSGKDNSQIPSGMSNKMVVQAAKEYMYNITDIPKYSVVQKSNDIVNQTVLINQKEVVNAIKNIPRESINVEAIDEIVRVRIKQYRSIIEQEITLNKSDF